jgi:Protein of unknown function (DUF3089)
MRTSRRWRAAVVAIVGCVAIGACSSSSSQQASSTSAASSTTVAAPATTAAPAASTPASSTVWLCRPGLADNPCDSSETATVVSASGQTSTQQLAAPATPPKIDCFYVYPTVSDQKTAVANLHVDPEERAIAETQASRFSPVCRIYAPMYRQATLAAINGATAPGAKSNKVNIDVGYQDVLAAWNDYLAHDNDGRGVVLLGHSQGSGVLIQLMKQEIDPNPSERRLLVSAVILGGNVTVKQGRDIGGDFQHIPACRSLTQTGCVVAYSSFLQPPPANSLFARPGTGPRAGQAQGADLQVLCVNPAAPAGGTAAITSYFPTAKFPGLIGTLDGTPPKAPTPWVSYPGRYTAQCTSSGGATWLQIRPVAGDARPTVAQTIGPTWGLHLYDFNLPLGNLVSLVSKEAAAYKSS